jgi:glycine cleavage system protein P-like pyridoxal-binding family
MFRFSHDQAPVMNELQHAKQRLETVGRRKQRPLDLLGKPEVESVRHYTRLSQRNYSIDLGMYPLGSCTMKYNPKRNDRYANLDGFRHVHPLQPATDMQGTLKVMHRLEHYIAEITGMDGCCLHPAAGAQGELTGLLMMRRHFLAKGEKRDVLLIADSAHGTNPSSASMAGFTCEIVATDGSGLLSIKDLQRKMNDRVAGLMITNPSTLGLFEENIADIASIVHASGGLLYYDGANLNALMGLARPGDMGFDLVHINVHKTLSTPHGGGGPGAGPVAAKKFLLDYAPIPRIVKVRESELGLDWHGAVSLGKLKQHIGHVSVLIRAYCYVRTLGAKGLRQASEDAVLSANYVQHKLASYFPPVFEKNCMHECLLSADKVSGASALALAKRMIAKGVHPPTLTGAGCVWFPAAFQNTLLIEPTETESLASLDHFVEKMIESFREIRRTRSDAGDAFSTRSC